MFQTRFVIFYFCIIAFTVALTNIHDHRYAVVVDAGSTGNRAFLFKISISHDHKHVELIHREMKKRGIADYLDDLPKIKDILLPLLKKVSEYIPTQVDIDETVLFIRATGGMRSLSTDDQSALWSAVVGMLEDDPTTPFHINPHNFGTISGKLEAYYAVIAANYVAGRVDSPSLSISNSTPI